MLQVLLLSLFLGQSYACVGAGTSFACTNGAVIETYGGDGNSIECGLTDEPLVCSGSNCELRISSATMQIYDDGNVLGGCTPFLISSRQCRGACLTSTGAIDAGTFLCESSPTGEEECPSCASACASYNG